MSRFLALTGTVAVLSQMAVVSGASAQVKPAAPDLISSSVATGRSAAIPQVRKVAVTMMLGKELIWSGTLSVGGTAAASISISEPVDDPILQCGSARRPMTPTRRITLSIRPYRSGAAQENYRLNAQYSRPVGGENACDGNNSRTVSIQYSFDWDDEKSQIFEGDGGFRVKIVKQ